jgi:hypothetical protein
MTVPYPTILQVFLTKWRRLLHLCDPCNALVVRSTHEEIGGAKMAPTLIRHTSRNVCVTSKGAI